MNISLDYARLATPPGDGDILIEPVPRLWPALIEQNAEHLRRQSISLAGRDVREVRRQLRSTMGASDPEGPILASGHQPGFAHPGVWAKDVVSRELARRLQIRALNLVVDNDAPTQPDLIVPKVRDGLVTTHPIPFSSAPGGCAYERRPALRAEQLQNIRRELEAVTGDLFSHSLMPAYLDAYPLEGSGDFVDQHVTARAAIDAPFNALLDEYRVSRVFDGPFVADLLLNAGSFAEAYNYALHDYRRREQVRSPLRPLPDLGREGNRVETALWVYQPLERRRRLWVEPGPDGLRVYADHLLVADLSSKDLSREPEVALATLSPWLVRPRALSLMLWARLLVSDVFIHGIGGAKYDRISDDIFRRYYHFEPPGIACVSATLALPLPRHSGTIDDLRRARRDLRDIRFNPQRYLSEPPADLMARRDRLITESRELRDAGADRAQRRGVYLALRAVNQKLVEYDPDLVERSSRRAEQITAEWNSNRVAASREFFYALQPPGRLQRLADNLMNACAPS